MYVLGSTTVYNCITHEPIIKQLQGFFNAGPSLCFPASVVWLSLATATICVCVGSEVQSTGLAVKDNRWY